MWSGAKVLDTLLALEAYQHKNRWFVLAIIPVSYYALHFLVIDTSYEMRLSIAMDALSVFLFFSLVLLRPLHIALGKDIPSPMITDETIDSHVNQHPLHLFTPSHDHLFHDATLRFMGYSNLIAFLFMAMGDIGFFVHLGWFHEGQEEPPPPIWSAVIYILGSIFSNTALGLGSAYVALTHNLIAAQLQSLAHQLEAGLSVMGNEEENQLDSAGNGRTYGTATSDNNGYPLLGAAELSTPVMTAEWLARQHAEFRRRQDALAPVFHRRVLVALIAFSIELVFSVTAGYEEQREEFTNFEVTAMIVMFFGNAYSCWTIAFSMGRVPFVSREETAFAAHKRALLGPDPSYVNVANTMTHFPITFHVGPFEWSSEISKAYTLFVLSLAGIFVGIQLPAFE